jgi:FdhE protein
MKTDICFLPGLQVVCAGTFAYNPGFTLYLLRRIQVADEKVKAWAEKLEREIAALLDNVPEYDKLFEMYRAMLLAQNEAKAKFPEVKVDMDANRAAVCANTGISLLNESSVTLDREASEALFTELKEIAVKHGEEYVEEVKKIDDAIESGKLDVGSILQEAFDGGPAEELKKKVMDMDLDPHLFGMLVFSSLRPSLELYAEKLMPMLIESDWEKRYCPICGHLPYMAKLVGQEGKRVLCCPACSCEWRFPRLKCVNCGIEDHEKLRMLYPEGGSKERYADVCDNCKRYLKVVDARKLAEQPIMQIADAGTLHIDMLAQREGFVAL